MACDIKKQIKTNLYLADLRDIKSVELVLDNTIDEVYQIR